jgi:UDP-N-acetyl-2-amino-2-deoxyglucuronate dehydrogenase
MKFALIGTGFIMPRHAQAIINIGGEIVDVINDIHSVTAWRKMIKKTNADWVVILTPNDLHFEMIMMALEYGKKVLCEKPLAIKLDKARILAKKRDIFTVLQLRHHPITQKLKKEINEDEQYKIEIDVAVHRDKEYFESWKGEKKRSGGILFNIGIHYFDMLLYLFGKANKTLTKHIDDKKGEGIIRGKNYLCHWKININEKQNNQHRIFKINGINYNFSSKDNLSYENLHQYVYQDLLKGKGVSAKEALKSIKLVELLYE